MSEISHMWKNVRTLPFQQVGQVIEQATLLNDSIPHPSVLANLSLASRGGASNIFTNDSHTSSLTISNRP